MSSFFMYICRGFYVVLLSFLKSAFKSVGSLVDASTQHALLTGLSHCTAAVCPVIASPQTVEDLSEKHLTVHLVRADVRLLRRQAAAGDQLSEGLRGAAGGNEGST